MTDLQYLVPQLIPGVDNWLLLGLGIATVLLGIAIYWGWKSRPKVRTL